MQFQISNTRIFPLFLVFSLGLLANVYGQRERAHLGSPTIEALYGTNFTKQLLQFTLDWAGAGSGLALADQQAIGPMCIRADFPMGGSKWSGGLEAGYNNYSALLLIRDSPTADPDMAIRYRVQSIALLGRFAFHIPAGWRVDPYIMFALGYQQRMIQATISDYPSGANPEENTVVSPIPVGVRLGFGCRVAVTPQLNLVGEASLGGTLLSGGLSWRFYPREWPTVQP